MGLVTLMDVLDAYLVRNWLDSASPGAVCYPDGAGELARLLAAGANESVAFLSRRLWVHTLFQEEVSDRLSELDGVRTAYPVTGYRKWALLTRLKGDPTKERTEQMRFTNENGETMTLVDNLTLRELLDMGVSISVSEETDPDQQIWLAEPDQDN